MRNEGESSQANTQDEWRPGGRGGSKRKNPARPDGTKVCNRCSRQLPVSQFSRRSKSCDGLMHICRDCLREVTRDYKRRQQSGVTPQQVEALLAKQRGVCAICGQPERTSNRGNRVSELAVDHDHTTGTIRGLLCARCNLGLGYFNDDVNLIRRAQRYLEGHDNTAN